MAELNSSAGKSKGKNRTKKMPVRVDLTAMVDLAFLLITFFMLTTSLAKHRVKPLAMPSDGPPGAVSEKTTMTIALGKNDKVIWYLGMPEKPLTVPKVVKYGKELRVAIEETGKEVLEATGKGLMVLVKPADHSVYANLVDALDELGITGVRSYAISRVSASDVALLKKNGLY